MTEISNNQNLNSHYSSSTKTNRPSCIVVSGPTSLPKSYSFNDKEANNKLRAINQDIYLDSQKEENKSGIKFIKVFGGLIAAILAVKGIKSLFKKS